MAEQKQSMAQGEILTNKKKKQPFISYLKGFAIVAVMIIHIVDWGSLSGISFFALLKEFMYPGVFIFVAMIGSLMYYAYKDADMVKATKKLIVRGLEILGIYFLYSIVKLFIYDFQKEPFYGSFVNSDKIHDLINILTLKSSDVPLTILFMLGVFMIISPIFLLIIKRSKYPKITILTITTIVVLLNYFIQLPHNFVTNILYSNGYVVFPMMLWLVPYLVGILLSMIGLESKRKIMFIFSGVLTVILALIYNFFGRMTILPSYHMYPLDLYYVVFSVFFVYLLIYLFVFIQNIGKNWSKKFLDVVTFLGENTLSIYIVHWIVIDLTYWIFSPNEWVAVITVPVIVSLFVLIKFKTKSKIVLVK